MTGVLADPAAGLSDEEAMFLGVIRELTAAEIEPRAGAIEAAGSVPDELADDAEEHRLLVGEACGRVREHAGHRLN